MQQQETSRRLSGLWIVVKVESGIPVEVEVFPDRESAEARDKILHEQMHPENDEIGIFEVRV